MKRDPKIIDALLAEVESMPIPPDGFAEIHHFFHKMNDIEQEVWPFDSFDINSAIVATHQYPKLKYSLESIIYHLKLLIEDDFIKGEFILTTTGPFISVNSLLAKGHDYLETKRKFFLLKAWSSLRENAHEWSARILFTKILMVSFGAISFWALYHRWPSLLDLLH
ncbi:DUF2513 domain-containing protein [Synechococcus elongatus]|uniref:DUF2513 domain-containing protein n=1 Tax=Synechococcus elongatus TaxID=32046 RepID=UPI000F7EDA1A|nr:DUF2513 domain-containing protein [Synechococcus elongatus]